MRIIKNHRYRYEDVSPKKKQLAYIWYTSEIERHPKNAYKSNPCAKTFSEPSFSKFHDSQTSCERYYTKHTLHIHCCYICCLYVYRCVCAYLFTIHSSYIYNMYMYVSVYIHIVYVLTIYIYYTVLYMYYVCITVKIFCILYIYIFVFYSMCIYIYVCVCLLFYIYM